MRISLSGLGTTTLSLATTSRKTRTSHPWLSQIIPTRSEHQTTSLHGDRERELPPLPLIYAYHTRLPLYTGPLHLQPLRIHIITEHDPYPAAPTLISNSLNTPLLAPIHFCFNSIPDRFYAATYIADIKHLPLAQPFSSLRPRAIADDETPCIVPPATRPTSTN